VQWRENHSCAVFLSALLWFAMIIDYLPSLSFENGHLLRNSRIRIRAVSLSISRGDIWLFCIDSFAAFYNADSACCTVSMVLGGAGPISFEG
jgi:hypothetical protein